MTKLSAAFLFMLTLCLNAAHAQTTGGKLIFCRNRTLYAVPITASGELQSGRTPHKITRLPNGTTLSSMSVSADGRIVAFCTCSKHQDTYSFFSEETSAIWTIEQKPNARLKRLGHGERPQFSPSGARLVYCGTNPIGESEYLSIYMLDLATGRRRMFRHKAYAPCWSGKGNEIALIDESGNDYDRTLMVVDAETGKQVHFQQKVFNATCTLLSPNGRFLAYNPHLSRPKLPGIITDRKTGELVALPYEGSPVLDWSVDSCYLLWTRYLISPHNDGASLWEEIWTTTADGRQSHKIGAGISGCFAPDGRHVIYLRTQAAESRRPLGLYVADLRGHRHKLLTSCDYGFVVWKPRQSLCAASEHRQVGVGSWKK